MKWPWRKQRPATPDLARLAEAHAAGKPADLGGGWRYEPLEDPIPPNINYKVPGGLITIDCRKIDAEDAAEQAEELKRRFAELVAARKIHEESA